VWIFVPYACVISERSCCSHNQEVIYFFVALPRLKHKSLRGMKTLTSCGYLPALSFLTLLSVNIAYMVNTFVVHIRLVHGRI